MRDPELVSDNTLAGIRALTAELTQTLVEAEALRARVLKARAANVWPELQSFSVFRLPPSAEYRPTVIASSPPKA